MIKVQNHDKPNWRKSRGLESMMSFWKRVGVAGDMPVCADAGQRKAIATCST